MSARESEGWEEADAPKMLKVLPVPSIPDNVPATFRRFNLAVMSAV